MKKIALYIQDTYSEFLTKVTWPTWNELQASAIVVAVASLFIALIIYLMDTSLSFLLKTIYEIF
ncbi:MAG: preprotein translocase subunit SecE [Bacteroidetes bacterium]|nr:preprotein translocase subunit SecE [Bacteroidota bacterium]